MIKKPYTPPEGEVIFLEYRKALLTTSSLETMDVNDYSDIENMWS